MPRRRGNGGIGGRQYLAAAHHGAARQHELGVRAVGLGQLLDRPGDEMLDIALIVGEQDPRLDGAPIRAGVMHETAQREVDPHGVEQGERTRPPVLEHPRAVGDLIADIGEHGRREMTRQLGDRQFAVDELVALFRDKWIGNFLAACHDIEARAELVDQRPQLLEQVLAEIGRLRHRRRIEPRSLELRPGAAREPDGAGGTPVDTQLGIAEAAAFLG